METKNQLVLVTGGTGFVGVHCILQLLQAGYKVRTTVRNLNREQEVRDMLKSGGVDAGNNLTFAVADLTKDAGWAEAVAGCDYVLHVASPFPSGIPKTEDELIIPAREGSLRVLKAARDAGVKRVVLTSSFAAIGYGNLPNDRPLDETDWTDPNGHISTYVKSKTVAERAAWDFMEREGGALELTVINPVGIFGPTLGKDISTSIEIIQRMLKGSLPGFPKMSFGAVDVRDVADMHLRAMTNPAAKGERFLAVAGDFLGLKHVAEVLKTKFGSKAAKVPTREFPDWLIKLVGMFDPLVKQAIPELGKKKNATNEKARRLLGWKPRTNEESIVASAESLFKLGLV